MRRVLLIVGILAFALASCGGSSDISVADPPKSTIFEKSENAKVNALVEQLKQQTPGAMQSQEIKPETIEQKVYESSANLEEIADFYKQHMAEKSWTEVQKMPGIQNGVLLLGFENGNTTFVVGAVDASALGGKGVIVYTVKGTK